MSFDSFLDGRIKAYQPKTGFRAGVDSVLLAAAINRKTSAILELGAGVGVASCCALADIEHASALLVEVEKNAIFLAQKNLEHNNFHPRARTINLDVTAKGSVRQEAGLRLDYFTSTVANPPFFDSQSGTNSPEKSRKSARHMPDAQLDKWVKTAAASTAPKGEIIFIHTMAALPQLLESFAQRFGNITLLPIAARPGENATRFLIRGIKGARAPLTMHPLFILHEAEGRQYAPVAEAIFRGKSRLHW